MFDATVVIAAWNASASIERSALSALAQDGVAVEVIIVDDASTDATRTRAEALADIHQNLHVVSLAQNSGPAAARNAGIDRARGDWIAVLDSDDTMRPGRLRGLIDFARSCNADVITDRLELIDESGNAKEQMPLAHPGQPDAAAWSVDDYIYGNLLHDGQIVLGFLKPIFRKAFLDQNTIRYDETLRNGEDFHLVLASLMAGAQLRFVDQPGYMFTKRKGSVSSRLDPNHERALRKADAAFLERHKDDLSAATQRLMRKRMEQNTDLATAEAVIEALKSRRLFDAASPLVKRPRATGRLFTQLLAALRKRLKGSDTGLTIKTTSG
ncbi:MAG: glycosyltransferase family 2 protein [Pseudomonadota bacterium]